MFICPTCYREIEEPNYEYGFWPFSGRFGRRGHYPVCPCGKVLTSAVVGNFSELSMTAASLRGLGISLLCLVLAATAEMRMQTHAVPVKIVPIITAMFALSGLIALWRGFLWSSQRSPVMRLAPRAYGAAAGYLIPAAVLAAAFLLGGLQDLSFIENALVRLFS